MIPIRRFLKEKTNDDDGAPCKPWSEGLERQTLILRTRRPLGFVFSSERRFRTHLVDLIHLSLSLSLSSLVAPSPILNKRDAMFYRKFVATLELKLSLL